MRHKLAYILTVAFGSLLIFTSTKAAASATLNLSARAGDAVQVTVTGEPNSNIQLSFLPSGASMVSTVVFGTTDDSGNFSTSISSGSYGIPQGSPAYVIVNGIQSEIALWPAYSSSITFNQTSVQLAVGQSFTINGSHALILAANNMASKVSTSVSGSQVTVTGISNGSGALTLCGANVGCGLINVTIGGEGQSQISFSENNITLNKEQTKYINVFGGSNNGYTILSNSNTAAVEAYLNGSSDVLSIYGKGTPGNATIVVCSVESSSNCANLNITNLSQTTASSLSFNPKTISLIPGVTQTVTVSGGLENSYYISSNSNSGVAGATIQGNILTVKGGSNAGTATISVCSTKVNATCGTIDITLTLNSTTPSATVLAFSQNVVSVAQEETTNVTVSGGNGAGYLVSSNSNPEIVTANINGGSNIISLYGNKMGSSVVAICAAGDGNTCASLYVTVGPAMEPIILSQSDVSLTSGTVSIVSISGGNGTDRIISSNSNSSAVTAKLNSDNSALILTGGSTSGDAIITVCSATYETNCTSLNVKITVSNTKNTNTNNTNTNTNTTTSTTNTSTTEQTQTKTQLEKVADDTSNLTKGIGIVHDDALEAKVTSSYIKNLKTGVSNIGSETEKTINNFIAYGTQTTKNLGEGERAGVIASYKKAFNKLPATENEWEDVIKIANGRWPSKESDAAIKSAQEEFKKVYKRAADMNNTHDNAAISIIAYGLRPTARNLSSEAFAIKTFKSVYGHNPASALAWDIVRAIAYSGAQR